MRAQECIFTQPLSLDDLQAMFTSAVTGVVNLFGEGCCIDTEPPFPAPGREFGVASWCRPRQGE